MERWFGPLIDSLCLVWQGIKDPVFTVVGGFLGFLLVFLILWLLGTITRRFFAPTRCRIRIQLSRADEKATPIEQQCIVELRSALERLRGDIAYLERRLAFPGEALSYFFNYEQLLGEAEGLYRDVEVELSIGPVKLGNLERLVYNYLGRREFLLQIRVSPGSDQTCLVDSRLSLNGGVWYDWPQKTVSSSDMPVFCRDLAHELVWLMSLPDSSKASELDLLPVPEIHLLKAIKLLRDYLQNPSAIESLGTAVEHLRHARRERWAFYSDLLEAVALHLVQRSPKEAVQLMSQLVDRYGVRGRPGTTLLYNYAVATFHQYEIVETAYDEAIGIFTRIQRPTWPPPRRKTDSRHDWMLYLLAQAGIANCVAHKLRKAEARDRQPLLQKMRGINVEVREDLRRKRLLLGSLADEVEWRLWNAEAVSIYFIKGDAEEGLDRAERGLVLHPENLYLKANRGSLFLLKYLQAPDERQKKQALQEADTIFTELETTGWQHHFVRYRLGRVRRLQQRWQEAIELLESARGSNVPDAQIDEEIRKAKAESTALDP